jgi:predicted RNA-binding Zn ribbon-like protein
VSTDWHADPGRVGALRFDGGSLSLNLVATVGRRFGDPVERLGSVERVQEWLAGVGLDTRDAPTDDDAARLRALREQLDALFRAAVAGEPPPAAALADVNAAVRAGVPRLSDDLALAPASLDAVLSLIAVDAVRILAGAERGDLHACEADDCRMLYLVRGRRARRWCSSERCGNRVRVAAHRARVRSTTA